MTRADLVNGLALAAAIAAALLAVALAGRDNSRSPAETIGGAPIRTGYRRIASTGIMSDAILAEICEPERVAAWSVFSDGPDAYRLGPQPRLKGIDDLEAIIALRPDLVLVSTYGGEADRLARLRDAGLTVCDLGPQGGLEALAQNADAIGRLIGAPQRADHFIANLRRRLAGVAASLPRDLPRRRAVYVQLISDHLYGGTVGTSYHDVLVAAGLDDLAAGSYRNWPQYTVEQLIALDPEVIVTLRGAAVGLRRLPGIGSLRAAQAADGIIEIDSALLEHPGPIMLEAAETLFAAAYPQYAGKAPTPNR
jgi:iron complex transport system substrate-binding protein